MDLGLGLLLASLASPLVGSLFGGNKQTEPFKGWMSPSLGMQDPYLMKSVMKRGLQYGIGDPQMYTDMMRQIQQEWPNIMRLYKQGV